MLSDVPWFSGNHHLSVVLVVGSHVIVSPDNLTGSNLCSQDPIVRPLHELDTSSLLDLWPEVPLWVKHPDCERASPYPDLLILAHLIL